MWHAFFTYEFLLGQLYMWCMIYLGHIQHTKNLAPVMMWHFTAEIEDEGKCCSVHHCTPKSNSYGSKLQCYCSWSQHLKSHRGWKSFSPQWHRQCSYFHSYYYFSYCYPLARETAAQVQVRIQLPWWKGTIVAFDLDACLGTSWISPEAVQTIMFQSSLGSNASLGASSLQEW